MKKLSIILSISFVISIIILLTTCKTEENFVVQPVLPELDIAYTPYSIDAEKGGDIFIKSGTKITIPADAFIDKEGNLVKGKVEIKYREFHEMTDILLSGIPMAYDSAGVKSVFQTAGMFEFRANQGENDLKINPERSINVQLASFTTGDQFNFYKLDEETGNWNFSGTKKAEENNKKTQLLDSLKNVDNGLKFPLSEEYFVFDYNSVLDIYYKDNYKKIKKNKNNPKPKTKAEKYGLSWSGIYTGKRIYFKGGRYPATLMVWKRLQDKKIPLWANEKTYVEKLSYLGNNQYYMLAVRHKDDKKLKFGLKIEAVMAMKHLFANEPDTWINNYEKAVEDVLKAEERAKMMNDVYRTFEINKVGYYNWDYAMKFDNVITAKCDFSFDKPIEDLDNDLDLFYVVADGKGYLRIKPHDWKKIMLVPEGGQFIAILPDKTIAKFGKKEYGNIDFEKLRSLEKPEYLFNMKSIATINSKDDLKKALEI